MTIAGLTRIDVPPDFGGGCPPLGLDFVAHCAENIVSATRLCPEALLAATMTQAGRRAVAAHFSAEQSEQARRLSGLLAATGNYPSEILTALRKTPRPDLVPRHTRSLGWWNGANCGPCSLTVFSPWLACYCLAALGVEEGDSVLILGYGGGFTTVLAANLVGKRGRVCALEIDPGTARTGRTNLRALGLAHAEIDLGSALDELPKGPFDQILGTLSTSALPAHWFAVLRPGGCIGAFIDVKPNSQPLGCSFGVYRSYREPALRAMASLINSPFDCARRTDYASDYPDLVAQQEKLLAALSELGVPN